ncbi:MAG: SufD family Fe-S cluster assembly protein [Candidatus Magnetomorum sp.]|nr:SufD family Fe-S cluster assembly protein [Candidatus Magnetomorum sp.]
MLDALDKELLKTVADLEGLPKGAYNIRKNGKLLGRKISANINIETNAEGTGIIISVAPNTQNESVHIPVILSEAGLHDVVYNSFIIGENADVTIIAGCGIHCGSDKKEGHEGIHDFTVHANARMTYIEKHYAFGKGKGQRTLNPTTKVLLKQNAYAEMILEQIGGVDTAQRVNEAILEDGASLLIKENVLTEDTQIANSTNQIVLNGKDSSANLIARSVIKGDSKQDFIASMEANNKCYGHIECDAIILDNGTSDTVPSLKARHPDAELTHEASIGKIADDQLMKLMSLGLTYDEAVNHIIQGFLDRRVDV